MKVYLVNATGQDHTLLGIFTFYDDVLDADFSDDEEYFVVGTQDGKVYEYARDCLKCDPGYYKNTTTISCELCWTTLQGCG